MEIGVWLRGLGLSQYEAEFHENSIVVDVLPDLTDGERLDMQARIAADMFE